MNSDDFSKLQTLMAKLKVASRNAAIADKAFKKYHQNSMELLDGISPHLVALQQGLSITSTYSNEDINSKRGTQKERWNSLY